MSKKYQVVIQDKFTGRSILEHRKRTSWTYRTAIKHALDISSTWGYDKQITLEEV